MCEDKAPGLLFTDASVTSALFSNTVLLFMKLFMCIAYLRLFPLVSGFSLEHPLC